MDLQALAQEVFQILLDIENESKQFQKQTGLTCLPECGQCCLSSQVEATPLEMLPLCLDMVKNGEALKWLEKLRQVPNLGSLACLLFRPQQNSSSHFDEVSYVKGSCGVYALRPSLCRLFGASIRKKKSGEFEAIVCKVIKQHRCIEYNNLSENQNLMSHGPCLSVRGAQISNLEIGQLSRPRSINEALLIMLEKVLLWQTYELLNSNEELVMQEIQK